MNVFIDDYKYATSDSLSLHRIPRIFVQDDKTGGRTGLYFDFRCLDLPPFKEGSNIAA